MREREETNKALNQLWQIIAKWDYQAKSGTIPFGPQWKKDTKLGSGDDTDPNLRIEERYKVLSAMQWAGGQRVGEQFDKSHKGYGEGLPIAGTAAGTPPATPYGTSPIETAADDLRETLNAVIEASDAAAEALQKEADEQKKITDAKKRESDVQEAYRKRKSDQEEAERKKFLDGFESMGKSGSELMEQFKKMREGVEQLDRKFAEITALAGSKEFKDLYGAEAQKKLQQDILRQQAAKPGEAGDLARARLRKQQEDEATEQRKRAFGIGGVVTGAIGSVVGGQGVAGGAAGIGGALGGVAGLAGGLATPTGAALKFGEAIFGSIDKVNKWTEGLHQANMQFAEFSGAMATVAASAEVHRIQLEQMKGEARAGTAEKLEQSRYEKDRAFAPVENAWANIKNTVGAEWNKFMAGFGQVVTTILGLDETDDEVEPELWQAGVGQDIGKSRWQPAKPPPGRFED